MESDHFSRGGRTSGQWPICWVPKNTSPIIVKKAFIMLRGPYQIDHRTLFQKQSVSYFPEKIYPNFYTEWNDWLATRNASGITTLAAFF